MAKEDNKNQKNEGKKIDVNKLAALRGCTVAAMFAAATRVGDAKAPEIKAQDAKTFTTTMPAEKPADKISENTANPFKIDLDKPISPVDAIPQEKPELKMPTQEPIIAQNNHDIQPEHEPQPTMDEVIKQFDETMLEACEEYVYDYEYAQKRSEDPEKRNAIDISDDKVDLYGQSMVIEFMDTYKNVLPAFKYFEDEYNKLDSLNKVMTGYPEGSVEHKLAAKEISKALDGIKNGSQKHMKDAKSINKEVAKMKKDTEQYADLNASTNVSEEEIAGDKKMDKRLQKTYKKAKDYISQHNKFKSKDKSAALSLKDMKEMNGGR